MKARVDKDKCIGCGLCEGICPAVFQMEDDGLAGVKVDVVPAGEEENASDAQTQCPVEAIEIEE